MKNISDPEKILEDKVTLHLFSVDNSPPNLTAILFFLGINFIFIILYYCINIDSTGLIGLGQPMG